MLNHFSRVLKVNHCNHCNGVNFKQSKHDNSTISLSFEQSKGKSKIPTLSQWDFRAQYMRSGSGGVSNWTQQYNGKFAKCSYQLAKCINIKIHCLTIGDLTMTFCTFFCNLWYCLSQQQIKSWIVHIPQKPFHETVFSSASLNLCILHCAMNPLSISPIFSKGNSRKCGSLSIESTLRRETVLGKQKKINC